VLSPSPENSATTSREQWTSNRNSDAPHCVIRKAAFLIAMTLSIQIRYDRQNGLILFPILSSFREILVRNLGWGALSVLSAPARPAFVVLEPSLRNRSRKTNNTAKLNAQKWCKLDPILPQFLKAYGKVWKTMKLHVYRESWT
jgi:hypothetical protein